MRGRTKLSRSVEEVLAGDTHLAEVVRLKQLIELASERLAGRARRQAKRGRKKG